MAGLLLVAFFFLRLSLKPAGSGVGVKLGFPRYDALEDLKSRKDTLFREYSHVPSTNADARKSLDCEFLAICAVLKQEESRRALGFESRSKREIEAELSKSKEAWMGPPLNPGKGSHGRTEEISDGKLDAEFLENLPGTYRSPEGGVLTVGSDGTYSFEATLGGAAVSGKVQAGRRGFIYRSEEAQVLGKIAGGSGSELEANFDDETLTFIARFSGDRKTELTVLWWVGLDEHRGTFRK